MILHGIYDKGKIKITNKNLPKIKTRVEIYLEDVKESPETDISKLTAFGMWKDRDEMTDSEKYVRGIRKSTGRRSCT